MASHNDLGRSGEARAAFHLHKEGYEIVARDWRHPAGEIDIIAKQGATYVFVEVKTRTSEGWGPAEAALSRKQQRRITTAALLWLKRKGGRPPCRFDLVVIDRGELRHHRDAFRPPPGCTY